MHQRKQLKDLTLKDNFMFCAVMSDPENCRPLLERVLGKSIGRITVDRESKDPYVMQLQTSIRQIKQSREMGGQFMLFTEMLEEEYKIGRKDGYQEGEKAGKISSICSILSDKGEVTEEMQHQLVSADIQTLDIWLKAAIDAKTPEEFLLLIRE